MLNLLSTKVGRELDFELMELDSQVQFLNDLLESSRLLAEDKEDTQNVSTTNLVSAGGR